jgi:hypothetical protein
LGFIAAIIQNKLIDLKIRFQSKETGGVPNEGGYGYIFDNVFATHNGSLFLLFHWTCIMIITAITPQQAAGNSQVRDILKSMFQSTYFSLFGHN